MLLYRIVVKKRGKVYAIMKERLSNLELLRIIAMLGIVASHCIMYIFTPIHENNTLLCDFLVIQGIWGKIGINIFMLISGYFMCTMDFSIKRYLKLFAQIITIDVFVKGGLLLSGIMPPPTSIKGVFELVFPWRILTMDHFVAAFLVFYLFSPFVVTLIKNLSQEMHRKLIVLCLVIYMGYEIIPGFVVLLDPIVWFSVLYVIAAYVRKYSFKYSDSKRFWFLVMLITTIIAVLSVVIGKHTGLWGAYKFSGGANTLFSLSVAFSSFMFFKNLNMRYSQIINMFGAATFGVLLIHSSCGAMRYFLLVDLFNTPRLLNMELGCGIAYFCFVVISIFTICAIIDILRKKCLEPSTLRFLYKLFKV